jgi:hypothetical protein
MIEGVLRGASTLTVVGEPLVAHFVKYGYFVGINEPFTLVVP